MAITLRGKLSETENNASVNSFACTNSPTAISAGDCIVVCVRSGSLAANNITVADNVNAGNYTKAVEAVDTTNGRTVGIYVKANSKAVAAGSLTVTATIAVAATCAMNGLVYIGAATVSPVDQTNSAVFTTATTTPTSGNITTTAPGDAVIGAFGINTAVTSTVTSEGGAFAVQFNDTLGTAAHQHLHTADQILSGTSTLAYAPTLSAVAAGVICVASIKALVVATDDPAQFVYVTVPLLAQDLQDYFVEERGILPTIPPTFTFGGAESFYAAITESTRIHFIESTAGGPTVTDNGMDGTDIVVASEVRIAGWEGAWALPVPPFAVQDDADNEHWTDVYWSIDQDIESGKTPPPPTAFEDAQDYSRNTDYSLSQREDSATESDFPPTPPAVAPNIGLDDLDNYKWFGWQWSEQEDEGFLGLPFLPQMAWDEDRWEFRFDTAEFFPEDDASYLPLIVTPPPPQGWDEEQFFDWNLGFGPRWMAALTELEGVQPPQIIPPGGSTARSIRIGLSFPAHR